MRKRVAIVGAGPTGLYALQELITSKHPLEIIVFEAEDIAGKGTPYQRGINDPAMLSNIPSIEIPELPMTLVEWLGGQPKKYLSQFESGLNQISERAFYPRVVLGDYFRAQFEMILKRGLGANHEIEIRESAAVVDIVPSDARFGIRLSSDTGLELFDYVIVATGHSFQTAPETSQGFFEAPWPATALRTVPCGEVGVLGTSLSAIDAVVTVAASFGMFTRRADGRLGYVVDQAHESFQATMMSRKGLLPEADFYFPIPYEQPRICTAQAVASRLALGSSGLLDDVFDLFRAELALADPDYARLIRLDTLTVDTFADAYYGVRDQHDPFEWAAINLAEAKRNYAKKHTVAWRYAILITHEIIESAVGSLTADDLARFNRTFKSIFADDYATVPHLSIERLLALHQADRLRIVALGDNSAISSEGLERGAAVKSDKIILRFDTFIDATGQKTQSVEDLPFPSLKERGFVSDALTITRKGNYRRTGGVDVDDHCRPLLAGVKPVRRLYLPAISYLLHKRPFVQGITSAAELGQMVARSIKEDIMRPVRSRRARPPRRRPDVSATAA